MAACGHDKLAVAVVKEQAARRIEVSRQNASQRRS
jgi:hypothetical protein